MFKINKQKLENKSESNSTFELFWLNMKTIFSTKSTTFVILFSPFIVTLTLSIMMPVYFYVAAGQLFVTTLSGGVIWGMTYYTLKSSTLNENIHLANIKKLNIYFSILLSMFAVTFFSQITFWFWSIIFSIIPIDSLASIFFDLGVDHLEMNWSNVDWAGMFYSWILGILIIFSISFVGKDLFKESKTYFIVLFVYLIFLIAFGGIIRPNMEYYSPENPDGQAYNLYGVQVYYETRGFVYWVSFFMPQTHISRIIFSSMSSGVNKLDDQTNAFVETWGKFEMFSTFKWSSDWEWNMTLLYPPSIILATAFYGVTTFEFISSD